MQFAQAVTDVPWGKIVNEGRTASKQAGLLAESRPEPLFSVSIGPGGVEIPGTPIPSNKAPNSVEFLRLVRPNFYEEKLALQRAVMRYETSAYTRWFAVQERASSLFTKVVQHYLNAVPILGVAVEYVDRFDADPASAAPDAGVVIKEDSPLIARRAFNRYHPWHSHAGWFDVPDEKTKRLVNVDVDVTDAQPAPEVRRAIQIRTSMTDFFNQSGFAPLSAQDAEWAFLVGRFDVLHDQLKELLSTVLTEGAAGRISLAGN